MRNFRKITTTLILITLLGLLSTEALAKRPSSGGTSDGGTASSLSYRDIRNLAKAYLADFQAIDPNIT